MSQILFGLLVGVALTSLAAGVQDGAIAVVHVMIPKIETLQGAMLEDSKGFRVCAEGCCKKNQTIFSFSNGKLTNYRAGRFPEVGWLEGCF